MAYRCTDLVVLAACGDDIDPNTVFQYYNLEAAPYPALGTKPLLNRKVFRAARVSILEYPFVVSIRRKMSHYLVGTILSKNLIITVAHPLHEVPLYELQVVPGENYSDRGTLLYTIVVAIVHEDFDPYTLENDIALLRLRSPLAIKNSVKYIPPLSAGVSILNNIGFVVGWGRCDRTGQELCLPRSNIYYPNETQDIMLRAIKFMLKPSRLCSKYEQLNLKLFPGMMCVGRGREERAAFPCMAVPGAPLVVFGQLAGMQSWGFGCGYQTDLPLIYTNVQHYLKWISDNNLALEGLTAMDFNPFYIATMAYTVANNLRKLRRLPPFENMTNFTLSEYPILDQVLAKTRGTVYDMRDYIFNGQFKKSKQAMIEYLRQLNNEDSANDIDKPIDRPKILPIPIPYFSNNSGSTSSEDYSDGSGNSDQSDNDDDPFILSDYDSFNYFS